MLETKLGVEHATTDGPADIEMEFDQSWWSGRLEGGSYTIDDESHGFAIGYSESGDPNYIGFSDDQGTVSASYDDISSGAIDADPGYTPEQKGTLHHLADGLDTAYSQRTTSDGRFSVGQTFDAQSAQQGDYRTSTTRYTDTSTGQEVEYTFSFNERTGDYQMAYTGNQPLTMEMPARSGTTTHTFNQGDIISAGQDPEKEGWFAGFRAGGDHKVGRSIYEVHSKLDGETIPPLNLEGDGFLYDPEYTMPPEESPVDQGTWVWNPYESKHYAKFARCIPALLYNYRKEKQINCLYRNCLVNHADTGLPITNCLLAFKERHCLYVESAQYREHGYSDILEKVGMTLLMQLPYISWGSPGQHSAPIIGPLAGK